MKIKNLYLKNFLSFNDLSNEKNEITLDKFNLLIGKNNSGKSNILKSFQFIKKILFSIGSSQNNNLLTFNLPQNESDGNLLDYFYCQQAQKKICFSFSILIEENDEIGDLLNNDEKNIENPVLFMFRVSENFPNEIKFSGTITYKKDHCEVSLTRVEIKNNHSSYKDKPLFDIKSKEILFLSEEFKRQVYKIEKIYDDNLWAEKYSFIDKALRKFINHFNNFFKEHIIEIPAIRKIDHFEHNFKNPQNELKKNVIRILDNLRDGRKAQRKNFVIIKKFIKNLIFESQKINSFEIIFPLKEGNRRELEIDINNQILPLSHFGSGVEQMLVLATEIVQSGNNKLILIEEPEAHFHPDLQRKFIKFLKQNEKAFNHQYCIATHSNIFINEFWEMGSKVFYLSTDFDKENHCSYSQVYDLDTSNINNLFNDLNVKASDILQTNSIIWVEGPSDRTYINYFINQVDSRFVEGVHYTIMFYGGKLLKRC